MSNSQQDDLEKYLEEKAKQKQEQQKKEESQILSAYDACVLKESTKIHELVAKAQREAKNRSEDDKR